MKKRLYGDDLLTRAELAKAIGKSKTTIRRWESEGKLKPARQRARRAALSRGGREAINDEVLDDPTRRYA